jgi:predicted MFS family arabinose efflux permease
MRDLLAPLRSPVYRFLWIASVASSVGTLMQAVAAAWVMTSLTASPLTVALVPVATLAPVFLFGLAGGVLADTANRRTFLLGTQLWMMLCAAGMGTLVLTERATPASLLALTVALGTGGALNLPAWQSLVQDLVPRQHVASAVALNSISFNTGRVLGPVMGGLLVGWIGAAPVFFLNAASFLGTVVVLFFWPGIAPAARIEGFWRSVGGGLRHARDAAHLHSPFLRLSLFAFGASAPLALLPLFARESLGLGPAEYGSLLGAFGVGSLLGGASSPTLRRFIGPSRTVSSSALAAGVALGLLGGAPDFLLAALALLVGGFTWVSSMVNLNVAVQTSVPAGFRGRIIAIHLTLLQGSFALGSLFAGLVAKWAGIPLTLWIFGAGLAVTALATYRHALPEPAAPPGGAA